MHQTDAVAQRRCKLDARCTRSDDVDRHRLHVLRAAHAPYMIRPRARVEQLAAERFRMRDGLQRQRMLLRALDAEVVGHAAECEHERIERDAARGEHFAAVVIARCADRNVTLRAIERLQRTLFELEAVTPRLHRELQLMRGGIDLARCGLVQQRLPEVRRRAVDENDLRMPALAERFAKTRGESQSTHAAANDDDSVRRSVCATCGVSIDRGHDAYSPETFFNADSCANIISEVEYRIG